MDFLKAEIARKKKQMEKVDVMQPNKTYFKRGDLAAKQEEEYWKKHKRLKTAQDDHAAGSGSSDHYDTDSPGLADDTPIHLPPRKDIIRRLRERNEPIILFGETEGEAYQRLRKLEISQPEINRGFKNDFKAAMDKVDEDYLNEILKSSGENPDKSSTNDVKVKDEGITLDEITKMAEKFGQGDPELDQEVILRFLKLVFKHWGEELNSRPADVKRSFKGKLASATHTQTVEYIKPLFRHLKRKSTKPDILDCLVDVIKNMINRDYLRANDAYLEMAIGNAPWPIGVTMVGIHARTGREKIFARNVAHVLNDETQRKYIQALKRLMTQCQKFFPTDPSRSVNFEPIC